ncbi:MAG: 16S rRNA (guanine(966)-N(2))-methyltransferase RsmD [Coriobacteriaceae bacterium]|nr:16S rRNA (guanine(966)-N(2))-methyltransferase RsmD [Coriobacteriaceae bacterium]
MRIVGGDWKGRLIEAPKGREVSRPTTDRVREAIASMMDSALQEGIEGARVLDAFAGTGALGLEMLSRGAACATFFDVDRGAAALIKRNLSKLGCDVARFHVVCGDVLAAARRGRVSGAPFDAVLIDPPYALGTRPAEELLAALAGNGLLAPDSVALFERTQSTPALSVVGFVNLREKRYGQTCIDVLRFSPDESAS